MKVNILFCFLLIGVLLTPSFIFAEDDLVCIWDQYIPKGENIAFDGYHIAVLGALATQCRIQVSKSGTLLYDETIDKGTEIRINSDLKFAFTDTMIGASSELYAKIKVWYKFLCYVTPSWIVDNNPTPTPTPEPQNKAIEIDYEQMWNIDVMEDMKTQTLFFDVVNTGTVDITVTTFKLNCSDNVVLSCFRLIKPSDRLLKAGASKKYGIAFTPSTVFLNNFEGSEFVECVIGDSDVTDSFYIVVSYYPDVSSEAVSVAGFKISINGQIKDLEDENKAYVGDLVYLIFPKAVKVNIDGWTVEPTEIKGGASWYLIPSKDAKVYNVSAGLRTFKVSILNKAKERKEIPKQIVSIAPTKDFYHGGDKVMVISKNEQGLNIDADVEFPKWLVPFGDTYVPFKTKTNVPFKLPDVSKDTVYTFIVKREGFKTYEGSILIKPRPFGFGWLKYVFGAVVIVVLIFLFRKRKDKLKGLPKVVS